MELFESNIKSKNLYNILEKLQYNSQTNNVGIYYVTYSENKSIVYKLSDPMELFEKEYIMKEYKVVLDGHVMSLSTVERIN